jgi:hypothetical protein
MKIFILLLLGGISCFGQAGDITKDTLQLNEVTVTKADTKQKLKRLKLGGSCSYPEDMKGAEEIITLVDDIPKGNLASVTFYFNKVDPETYKQNSKHFKESDLEVVLYDVNDDGMPGMPSAVEQQLVIVDRAHKGNVTAHLSLYNIDTRKKMFIGLRKLKGSTYDKSFLLDCLCSGQDKYATYSRKDASSPWERNWSCAALKLEVNVEVK